MRDCNHSTSKLVMDATGAVWCFGCQPPRRVTDPPPPVPALTATEVPDAEPGDIVSLQLQTGAVRAIWLGTVDGPEALGKAMRRMEELHKDASEQ